MGWLNGRGKFFSLESMVAVINSIVATTAISAFAVEFLSLKTNINIIIATVAFIIIYFVQYTYKKIRFIQADCKWTKKASINANEKQS